MIVTLTTVGKVAAAERPYRSVGAVATAPSRTRTQGGMPPASTLYTLVGFGAELDWRPVHFVRPIPRNRICSACGLVRRTCALLPCMHVLCQPCYEQCGEEGVRVCPLDNENCLEEDIDWKEFPAEELLKRKVKCWNAEHGCETTMAASNISRHFQRECGHHSVFCPKCSAVILCSDVCSHLKSGCERRATPLDLEDELEPCSTSDKACTTSLQFAFEQQTAESRKYFDRMCLDVANHSDRINEVCHGLNTLKESLKHELAAGRKENIDLLTKSVFDNSESKKEVKAFLVKLNETVNLVSSNISTLEKALTDQMVNATTETRDHFSQITSIIRSETKEKTETAVEQIREILGHAQLQVACSIFTVRGVKALQEEAMWKGWAQYSTNKVYLRGYCVSPGVYLLRKRESLKLHAWICLYKGDMDNFVQWPFQHRVRLCLVHPKDGSKLEFQDAGIPSDKYLQKPKLPGNCSCGLSDGSFDMNTIITDGYVENDNLVVKWELLPRGNIA